MDTLRRAFLVIGCEASGQRYMTRLLHEAGCAGGFVPGSQHEQICDLPDGDVTIPPGENFACCRSFPWGNDHAFLDLQNLADKLKAEFSLTVLWMIRDNRITELSQVAAGHVLDTQAAAENMQKAFSCIVAGLAGVTWLPVPYSSLASPLFLQWLFGHIGLSVPAEHEPFIDGDLKYV